MSKHTGESGLVSESAPMEQVRELLFGAQLKDMEIRFKRQEERFMREIHDTKDLLRKRLDSLEQFMKSEVSSLLNRVKQEEDERAEAFKAEHRERTEMIKAEQRERVDSLTHIAKELAYTNETFERKLGKLSGMLDSTEREIRQLLIGESSSLTDKIESKYQDALKVLSKTASQIRHDMVYRSALSGMLTEVVVKLSENGDTESFDTEEPFVEYDGNDQ